MKKLFVVSVMAVMCLGVFAKPVPEKALQYISEGFPEREVLIYNVKVNIELTLDDRTVVTFNSKGDWKEVDAEKRGEIPDSAVPEEILHVVKKQFPDARILKMDHKRKYEVLLSNGVELEFNKALQLIDIHE